MNNEQDFVNIREIEIDNEYEFERRGGEFERRFSYSYCFRSKVPYYV